MTGSAPLSYAAQSEHFANGASRYTTPDGLTRFEVIDHLRLHPSIPDRDPDDQLRVKVLEQLSSDPRVHAERVHVQVSHGRVTLTGYVRHAPERAAAVDVARNIGGVVAVSDEIQVR